MKTVDEARLESDLTYRYEYLAEFLDFGNGDMEAIQSCMQYLGPMIPDLVEKTYSKLLGYDATARHFLPRQAGYDGALPSNLQDLLKNHPHIQFRKNHLSTYFMNLLGRSNGPRLAQYLDAVGKMHTKKAGNREIEVPLVQMNALMGQLSDILLEAILSIPLEPSEMSKALRAFQKLFWIQNDFINRHYLPDTTA